MKVVTCRSCNKTVEVKPIRYGFGWVAICPSCTKLALMEDDK